MVERNKLDQKDTRAVELVGDSPELIAFVILKSIIQVTQARDRQAVFDKEWLLSNYAECLDTVRGNRGTSPKVPLSGARSAAAPARSGKAKRS
jgi:hypothetical protein